MYIFESNCKVYVAISYGICDFNVLTIKSFSTCSVFLFFFFLVRPIPADGIFLTKKLKNKNKNAQRVEND